MTDGERSKHCGHAWQVSAALEALLRKALLRPLPEVADESKAEAPAPAAVPEADQVRPLHCYSPKCRDCGVAPKSLANCSAA